MKVLTYIILILCLTIFININIAAQESNNSTDLIVTVFLDGELIVEFTVPEGEPIIIDVFSDIGDPVNVITGNWHNSETDIQYKLFGKQFCFSRTINSKSKLNRGFGHKWSHNFDIHLTKNSNGSITLVNENGNKQYFKYKRKKYISLKGLYSKLTENPDGTFLLRKKYGDKLVFDKDGKLLSITDRNENRIKLGYNDDGLLGEIVDPVGREIEFTYNSNGKISTLKDHTGRLVQYFYDDNKNLIKVINPEGYEKKYSYDKKHCMTELVTYNGNKYRFSYNKNGKMIKNVDPLGNAEKFKYPTILGLFPTNKTIFIDKNGNKWGIHYKRGKVVKKVDPLGSVRKFVWDKNKNLTKEIFPDKTFIQYFYDDKGNIIKRIDQLSNETNFTYENKFNMLTSVTDANGNETIFRYDNKGNLIEIEDALGGKTIYTYNSWGLVTNLTDANGNITKYNYDSLGNLSKVTDAQGNITSFSCDMLGNVISTTDARAHTISYEYDLNNRLTKIIYPDTTEITYTYDAVGNRLSVKDQENKKTRYSYDEVNRLVKVQDALANITTYTYDLMGNRTSVIDANSNITQYKYDSLNRLVKTITPTGKETTYTYDPVGNRISTTDAKDQTITYGYDSNNRLTLITYPDSSNVTYTYDAAGRKTSMTDTTGQTTYTYDALNRLISSSVSVSFPPSVDTISYTYDSVGNRISMTDQDGGITTYKYDSLNRLIKLTDPSQKITAYTYDHVSNLKRIKYPNNTVGEYRFDNLNRLTTISNKTIYPAQSQIISSYTYEYNPSGLRTKVTLVNGDYKNYSYDPVSRLTRESSTGTNIYTDIYTFDSAGNRLTKYSILIVANTTYYTYNSENQLLTETVTPQGSPTPTRTCTYTYDNNGNQVQRNDSIEGITTYEYDPENRLTRITYADTSGVIYTYDGAGRRVQSTTLTPGGFPHETTRYLYDGLNCIIERRVNPITFEQVNIATYTRGLSYGGGIGSIISCKKYGQSLYYHYDGIGTVTGLTDEVGTLIDAYNYYDAYGNRLYSQPSYTGNKHFFCTKETSDQSGLVYFGARYYDPRTGRWLTKDPLTWGPDDPQILANKSNFKAFLQEKAILYIGAMIPGRLNRYNYCLNNPVNLTDAWGNDPYEEDWEDIVDLFICGILDIAGLYPPAREVIKAAININKARKTVKGEVSFPDVPMPYAPTNILNKVSGMDKFMRDIEQRIDQNIQNLNKTMNTTSFDVYYDVEFSFTENGQPYIIKAKEFHWR